MRLTLPVFRLPLIPTVGLVVLGSSLSFSPIANAQEKIQQEAIADLNFNKQLEPADIVYQAHKKLRNAETALKSEDYKTAWKNYSSALQYYQTLKLTHPLWMPEVVKFRINDTSEKLDALKPKIEKILGKEQAAAEGIISSSKHLPFDNNEFNIPAELLQITNQIKALTTELNTNQKNYERTRTTQEAHLLAAEGKLQLWKKDNQTNGKIVSSLEAEIQRTKDLLAKNKLSEKSHSNKIQAQIDKLQAELSKHSNAPLKQDLEKYNKELGKRNDELRIMSRALLKSQRDAQAFKQKAKDMVDQIAQEKAENERLNNDLKSQSHTSAKVLKGLMTQLEESKKREKTLSTDLNEAKNLLAEITGKLDQQIAENSELKLQLEAVTIERDRLSTLIVGSADDRINKIAKQNIQLMQELRDARATLSDVTKNQGDNIDRRQKAERDLAIAKKRILTSQEQNLKDTQQMLALKKELAMVKAGAEGKLSNNNLSPIEREENKILRNAAIKYQRREAFWRKKWELEKRRHIANTNDPEAEALMQNELTKEKLQLTKKEEDIINKVAQVDGALFLDGVVRNNADSIIASSEKKVEMRQDFAENLIKKGKYELALDVLKDANEIIPNKFSTLMNLGVVNMRLRDLNSAEQFFEDGIVMKRNNPSVHYLLGITRYRMGNNDAAEKSLQFSKELDFAQEKVHYYLGVIAGDSGRLEQAKEHFLNSLRVNPELAEALMALSINSLMTDNIETAQDYYQKALQKGLSPVSNHAKKLGLPH